MNVLSCLPTLHGFGSRDAIMLYFGSGWHGNRMVICVLNRVARIVQRDQVARAEHLPAVHRRLPDPFEAGSEANCGHGCHPDDGPPNASL